MGRHATCWMADVERTIFSIGHSTRSLDAFLGLLAAYSVAGIADVRRFPGSRRVPHFAASRLAAALQEITIAYLHFPELGGRRRPHPDSPNLAWHNDAFRGYADYLTTPAFATGLDRLLAFAAGRRIAFLCAEALWWRCHRRLIADVLVVRGYSVEHILGPGATVEHHLAPFARLDETHISYPAAPAPPREVDVDGAIDGADRR